MNNKCRISVCLVLVFSITSGALLYGQHEKHELGVQVANSFQTGMSQAGWDVGAEYFLTKNQSVQVSFISQLTHRQYTLSSEYAQLSDLGAALHYNRYFYSRNVSQSGTWIYLYATIGGEVAREKIRDDNTVPSDLSLNSNTVNLYGMDLGLGSEVTLSKHFSFFGTLIPRYECNYKEWMIQGRLGVKYFF